MNYGDFAGHASCVNLSFMKRLLSVGVLALGLPLACGGVASSEQAEADGGGPGGSRWWVAAGPRARRPRRAPVGGDERTGWERQAQRQGGSAGSGGTSAQGGSAGSGGSGQGGSGQGGAPAVAMEARDRGGAPARVDSRDATEAAVRRGAAVVTRGPSTRDVPSAPLQWLTCNASALTCSYNYFNGCLCTPMGLYNCPQVDLTCPANLSGTAFAPWFPPDAGTRDIAYVPDSGSGGATAPAPQARTCSCSGTSWSCLPN